MSRATCSAKIVLQEPSLRQQLRVETGPAEMSGRPRSLKGEHD